MPESQVVASGKLNTGIVDLGQRPGEFCVTYNKTRQSSCIKYTWCCTAVTVSFPRMWTSVVWSVCEGFILLTMSSGLIHLSITAHLKCMWLLLLGTSEMAGSYCLFFFF